jgi:hypothetical protein
VAYICTVVFNCDVEALERVETIHPEIMDAISAAARGRMLNHVRYTGPGRTMDIDTFATPQDYEEFIAEAKEHIARYCELAGAEVVDTVWGEYAEPATV